MLDAARVQRRKPRANQRTLTLRYMGRKRCRNVVGEKMCVTGELNRVSLKAELTSETFEEDITYQLLGDDEDFVLSTPLKQKYPEREGPLSYIPKKTTSTAAMAKDTRKEGFCIDQVEIKSC